MKIYLISNNLLLDSISYDYNEDLDTIRKVRPLSLDGEILAKEISKREMFTNISNIYCSEYASSIGTAKYFQDYNNLSIHISKELNECKVGILGSKNMKMVKGLQDHEFTYKLPNGESLIDVGNRLDIFINKIHDDALLFTHKRAIVGFLLKHSKPAYNLDENLILQFNNKVIYDDSETDIDIYEITYDNSKIIDIKRINE